MSDRDVLDMDLEENEEKELLGESLVILAEINLFEQLSASSDMAFPLNSSGVNSLGFNPCTPIGEKHQSDYLGASYSVNRIKTFSE